MMDPNNMIVLLGKSREDPEVLRFTESIGGAEVEEIEDVWFICFRKQGVSFRFDDDSLRSIELYLKGDKDGGFKPYEGPLPHGLKKSLSRDQVNAKIGEPAVSKPGWAIYQINNHAVHIGYDDKGLIQSTTLLNPSQSLHLKNLKKK
jgi:hypothetical protein